jgi:predicted transcriptional regulator
LKDGKKTLNELRDALGVSSTTAIHALRDLESGNLAFQDEHRDYALTKIGEVIALKLTDFMDAIDVLKKHEDFWLTHDLSGIPEHLFGKIGWLKDSTLIEAPATNVFKTYSTFVDILKNAEKISGVSSVFVPDFSFIFETLIIEKKADVQLVVTKEVLEKIDQEILKEIVSDESSKFKLYILKEGTRVAFTVTDRFISLGLFNFDGTYDWNKDLISSDKKAVTWGNELFEYYVKKAESLYL